PNVEEDRLLVLVLRGVYVHGVVLPDDAVGVVYVAEHVDLFGGPISKQACPIAQKREGGTVVEVRTGTRFITRATWRSTYGGEWHRTLHPSERQRTRLVAEPT
ncbi:unnamed protein product, partial [Ectocarpus sp. 8 AP-2014]